MLQSIIQNLENQQPIVKIVRHEGTQTVTNKHNDDSETDCVWSITQNVAKQRKKEPTGDVLPKRSKERRRAETLTVTSLIQGTLWFQLMLLVFPLPFMACGIQ